LTALPGTVAVKTGQVSLRLLDCAHQFALFSLACLNVVPLGNFPYLIDFHVLISFSCGLLVQGCTVP
jgi:hypothetical protein